MSNSKVLFSLLFGSWSASNALLPQGLCQVDVYVLGGVLDPLPHKTIAYSVLGIAWNSSDAFKVGLLSPVSKLMLSRRCSAGY